MEAARTLTKKKSFSKGKLKKTIKNILYRPDPVVWKVKGLVFGITYCSQSLQKSQCGAVILDADIQPQLLVQHIIDSCNAANKPCICLKNLKETSLKYFGFKSCCIGVTSDDNVSELLTKIYALTKTSLTCISLPLSVEKINDPEKIEVEEHKENSLVEEPPFTYLYRTSTLSRVFEPPTAESSETKGDKKFTGQNFIGMNKSKLNKSKEKYFNNMIVKQVTNNPNRKRKNK